MGRWEPNARERLAEAALALYAERGFDQTTVAEIAARAGLTERTFFRYFTDKREVLFSGSEQLRATLVEAVAGAPAGASPLDAVALALEAAGAVMQERTGHERARQRHAVIASHAELTERELIKLASLAAALTEALRRRGIEATRASLAAEAGIAAFKVAFQSWLDDRKRGELPTHVRTAIDALKTIAGGRDAPRSQARPARRRTTRAR